MKNNEFYIGWMAQAPKTLTRFIKRYVLLMLLVILVLALLLGLSQRRFGTGNFEFGQLTEIKGIYFSRPVPCIKVVNGRDIWGNLSYLTMPLVGYGKHGAEGIIGDIEKEKHVSLDRKEVVLKGTLLYNDGKTILQIDGNDHPLSSFSAERPAASLLPVAQELGKGVVRGEIVDTKCYFGVMKPGEGKPHRDCAIRCILGGIPPILVVKNDKGEANYYLVLGPNGEKMNQAVQDFVGEPVALKGRLVQYDDWVVLYVEDPGKIERISYLRMKFGDKVVYCSEKKANHCKD